MKPRSRNGRIPFPPRHQPGYNRDMELILAFLAGFLSGLGIAAIAARKVDLPW